MEAEHKTVPARILAIFTETFGLGRAVTLSAALLIGLVTVFAVFWFFHSAPPHTLIITSGPQDSIFRANAEKYRVKLARYHVKLKILSSEGSLENLKRLNDHSLHVDIGFVQGGMTNGMRINHLVSLGSVSYEPLLVFYRGAKPVELLSGLAGKRLAIGPSGSGTHALALTLLAANGIEPGGATTLLDMEAEEAAKFLLGGRVDAVFVMSDSASLQTMRTLLRTPGIQLFDFTQADAYTRKIGYLNKLELSKGSIDFGKDIPPHDVHLIGPTVELVARDDLHPALSDLLLEAAREVHGGATILQRRGEFPAPFKHEFPISADAQRFYASGKSFFYRYLPFWMASLVNRVLVVFVPMFVILIPGLRLLPAIYHWQIRFRIYRWYSALLELERDLAAPSDMAPHDLPQRLDRIEKAVNKMKVPASFANQFYDLRGHINFVRTHLNNV